MSTPECRNNCAEPLAYPRRPYNRPGLSRIEYRIGAYGEIRQALLRNLNRTQLLSGWTHQQPDDPGIALLEGAAVLGDILTLYQDVYANEAFLSTAAWRESIADLVRLLGYRLAPGLGGRGTFALEVSGDLPVTIPKGFALTAQVTGMDATADFETSAELVAYPWLSRFNLFRPQMTPPLSSDTQEFVISSPDDFELAAGDKLLVGVGYPGPDPSRLVDSEVVIVDSVREQHGRKLYKLRGSLVLANSVHGLVGFKLGRTFRHFGHASPNQKVTLSGGTASQSAVSHIRMLATTTGGSDVDPAIGSLEIPLEGKVDGLALGVPLICRSIFRRATALIESERGLYHYGLTSASTVPLARFRTLTAVRPGSHTWGAQTGPATVAVLEENLETTVDPAVDTWTSSYVTYDRLDIREAELLETRSPLLELRAAPEPTADSTGHDLFFFGTDAEAQTLSGRQLLLVQPGADPAAATVKSVRSFTRGTVDRPALRRLTLDAVVDYGDYSNDTPTVDVYGNLADATQGKTERSTPLGNGDARQIFQSFELPKPPLTYLADPAESPPQVPELQIYVDDLLWSRVETLYGHKPTEQIYIVREDSEGTSWVQFGDGLTGARLPSGIKNVVAVERTGQGAYGPVKPGTKPQPGGHATGLDRVDLPGVVSGGIGPESGENARQAAPGKVQALGRLVSIRDFETETLAIAGVSLVRGAWQLVDNVAAVVLTVLMDTGRAAELAQVRDAVAKANRCRGPRRFPVVVQAGSRMYVYVGIKVSLDPSYKQALVQAAIEEALGVTGDEGNGIDGSRGLFSTALRSFGEREYATRIEGVVQNAPGVLWSEVTALGLLDESDDPASLDVPTPPWPLVPVADCAADEVLALYASHLSCSFNTPPTGDCS